MRISFCLFLTTLIAQLPAHAETILLRGGTLIDVESGSAETGIDILIKNDRIRAVGSNPEVPSDAQIVDLSGLYVMPGMIDAHSHVAGSGLLVENQPPGSLLRQLFDRSTAKRAVRAVANVRSLLETGFTTIRDVGLVGEYADLAIVEGIEGGWIAGPRMFASGKIIGPFGVHANAGLNPEHPELMEIDHIVTFTEDDVRRAVRENMQYGASAIKLAVEHGVLYYTEEEVRAAVDEASRGGLRVAAHSFTDWATQNAIRGGVTSIEHGFNVSDETLRMMHNEGVALVDTTFPRGSLDMATPDNYERWLERLRSAYEMGVLIAYGSDVFWHTPGRTRGDLTLENTRSYVDAQIPNSDILKFITINAATVIGIDADTGTIEAGKFADIIALEENPLADINALWTASFVMKAGVVYKSDNVFRFTPTGFERERGAVGENHGISE